MLYRTGLLVGLTSLVLLAPACAKSEAPEPATPAAPAAPAAEPAPAAPPAAPAAAAAPAAPAPEVSGHKMAHCPSTVAGAKTDVKDTPTGVEILVTGTGATVEDIRTRSSFLASAAKTATPGMKHSGHGEGSGAVGRCPVVLHNTTVEVATIEGGAKLTVTAKDPKELAWLRKETRSRSKDLQTPGIAEYGQKKMANCPSATMGAKTVIKDGKGAVEVTVTSADAAATTDIRERSKRIVEAAKNDSKEPHHTGTGTGTGAMGNCPVVLKDTTVEAKDVPGGSMLTVRPAKASDFGALKTETMSRNENLSKATAPH